jgi:hypothetical protein
MLAKLMVLPVGTASPGRKVLEDVAEVSHPWHAEDDADVDAKVHQEVIDLERLGVDAERHVEAGSSAGNLIATTDEDHSVDVSLHKVYRQAKMVLRMLCMAPVSTRMHTPCPKTAPAKNMVHQPRTPELWAPIIIMRPRSASSPP